MQTRADYFVNIQALRGIAALLIVVMHIILFGNADYYGNALDRPELNKIAHFFGFGVDLFFVISGFVMFVTTQDKSKGIDTARRFLQKRVVRIYPLYWLACVPLAILFFMRPNATIVDFFKSLFLIPHAGADMLIVAWTLEFEMYFYLVFSFLLLFFTRHVLIVALTLWAGLCVLVGYVAKPVDNSFVHFLTHPYLLEFVAGCWIGYSYKKWPLLTRSTWFLILGFGIGLLFFCNDLAWVQPVKMIVPITLCVAASVALEFQRKEVFPHILSKLGDMSYALYLIHIPVIIIIGRVCQKIGFGHADIMALLMLGSCVVSAMIMHRFFEKPLMNFMRGKQSVSLA